jgi:hypothetical protein
MDTNKFVGLEWVRVKEALHNLSEKSGATTEYAKGLLVGVVSTLMALGYDFQNAFKECWTRFPSDFRIKAIPPEWIGYHEDWLGLSLTHVTSFNHLVNDLPNDIADKVKDDLLDKYLYIIGTMANMTRKAKEPMMVLSPFRNSGSQWICEWAVKDMKKEYDPSRINWHGQETSQWVYAGAILVQDGRVSIHT